MSVVLLVRHGQASWGAADYDVLSPAGEEQSRVVGTALAARGVVPERLVCGTMKRQRETARLLAESAGWATAAQEDRDWDELDHVEVLSRTPRTFEGEEPTVEEFTTWFGAATSRWESGEHDEEYDEPFPAFGARVDAALDRLTGGLSESGTAVVVTSGGPIARVVVGLLGADTAAYRRLTRVVVNTAVTKVVVGRSGTTLVSFNEHGHLEAEPGLLTYR